MERKTYSCSTPVFGLRRSLDDIPLSEIRDPYGRTKSTRESIDSIITGNYKSRGGVLNSKSKQSGKDEKKRVRYQTDSNSDSEFETFDECEVAGNDIDSSDYDLMKNRLFDNTNNSPKPDKWNDDEKFIDVSVEEEVEMPTTSSADMFDEDFPMQKHFRDPSTYKCYAVPSLIKNKKKLTTSEISLFPKWKSGIPTKYYTSKDIPRRETPIESKYSHLRYPRGDKFKKFVSPRKESAGSSKMDFNSTYNREDDPDFHRVHLKKGNSKPNPATKEIWEANHRKPRDKPFCETLRREFERARETKRWFEELDKENAEESEFDRLKKLNRKL